jgi:hypothetical protein
MGKSTARVRRLLGALPCSEFFTNFNCVLSHDILQCWPGSRFIWLSFGGCSNRLRQRGVLAGGIAHSQVSSPESSHTWSLSQEGRAPFFANVLFIQLEPLCHCLGAVADSRDRPAMIAERYFSSKSSPGKSPPPGVKSMLRKHPPLHKAVAKTEPSHFKSRAHQLGF